MRQVWGLHPDDSRSSSAWIEARPTRGFAVCVVGCMLAYLVFGMALPEPATARVLPSDRVGDTQVLEGSLSGVAPDVNMIAGVLVAPDGRTLWSREATATRAIASITKVMTAVVVLDQLSLEDTLRVPQEALEIGESDSGLRVGERLTVKEALEAMLVKSGNDAALALAIRVAGNEKDFVKLMNEKAADLGLEDTAFANSYGLDEPGQRSSAADVAVLSRYAMTYPAFRVMVRKQSAVIGDGERRRELESTNVLLDEYRGADGIKTGWTNDAGYSLVASANRKSGRLFAVVLGADSESARFVAARKLLDWGFSRYRPRSAVTSGSVVGRVKIADYDDRFVPVLAARGATPTVCDLDGELVRTARYRRRMNAPVSRDETVGVLLVTQGDRLVATVPLVAGASIEAPSAVERIRIQLRRWWNGLFG